MRATVMKLENKNFRPQSSVSCLSKEVIWNCSSASDFNSLLAGDGDELKEVIFRSVMALPPLFFKVLIGSASSAP